MDKNNFASCDGVSEENLDIDALEDSATEISSIIFSLRNKHNYSRKTPESIKGSILNQCKKFWVQGFETCVILDILEESKNAFVAYEKREPAGYSGSKCSATYFCRIAKQVSENYNKGRNVRKSKDKKQKAFGSSMIQMSLFDENDNAEAFAGSIESPFDSNSAVAKVMRRFINEKDYGLALLPLETGYGKTYNAARIMAEDLAKYLSRASSVYNIPRRYIYVTPLIKNVDGAYGEFEKHILSEELNRHLKEMKRKHLGKTEVNLEDYVLIFKSIVATFSDFLLKDVACKDGSKATRKLANSAAVRSIPREVLNKGIIDRLVAHLQGIHNASNPVMKEECVARFVEFEQQKVRPVIKAKLKENKYCKKGDWDKILHSDEWIWLKNLYPAAYLDDYYIIFCSTAKLLNNVDPLWTGSSRMYERSDIIAQNTVIFADEIDAQKGDFMQMVAAKAANNSIDIIGAVNSIIVAIEGRELAEEWAGNDPAVQEKFKKLQDKFQGIRRAADKLNRKYMFATCQYRSKELLRQELSARPILFQDEYIHNLVEGTAKLVGVVDKGNTIYIVTENGTHLENKDAINIKDMLIESERFLGQFKSFVSDAAYAIAEAKKNEQKAFAERNGTTFIPESDIPGAVASVLDYFSITPELNRYFIDATVGSLGATKRKFAPEKSLYERNFHQDGFQCFVMKESRNASLRTPIQYYDVECSPEYVLLQICSKCKVIGLSATCLNTAVTSRGNFNLGYLHEQLGDDHFLTLSDEEVDLLKEERSAWRESYDQKISLTATVVGLDNTDVEKDAYVKLWAESLGISLDAAEDIVELLVTLPEKSKSFQSSVWLFERYRQVSLCYLELLKDPDIPRGLVFENAFFRDSELGNLRKPVLIQILNVIGECYGDKLDAYERLEVIDSAGFAEAFKRDSDQVRTMKPGEGKLLLTTYQTLAEGQNLQIPIPDYLRDSDKLAHLEGNRGIDDRMDIPLLYLAGPTHTVKPLPQWLDCETQEDFEVFEVERMLHIMDYQEMYYNGEILHASSKSTSVNEISLDQVVFRAFSPSGTRGLSRVDKLYSSQQTVTKMLNQAIGRINRSNSKYNRVTILIDAKAAQKASIDEQPYKFRTPEFDAVLERIKEHKLLAEGDRPDENIYRLEKQAKNRSDNAERLLQNAANRLRDGSEEEIHEKAKQWTSRRRLLLEYGCRTNEIPRDARNMYMEVPDQASQLGYKRIAPRGMGLPTYEIVLSNSILPEGYHAVSDNDATLDVFMTDSHLRDLFESEGFAVESPSAAKYVMLPPYEKALYQAAIGEVVGKWAFKKFLGIGLEEIEDIHCFEFFDNQVPNTNIFVDLKNWHENPVFRPLLSDYDAWIKEKADRCNAKLVMIVNAFSEDKKSVRVDRSQDGVILLRIDSLLDKEGNRFVINKQAEEKINKLMAEVLQAGGAND